MKKIAIMKIHSDDLVGFRYADGMGFAVVRRVAAPPQWLGGGEMVDVALYVRRDRGRPVEDFGALALMRVAPRDEWERVSEEGESRYFARHPPYCWTGKFLPRASASGPEEEKAISSPDIA